MNANVSDDSPETTLVHRDCPLCGVNNDDVPASRYSNDQWLIKDCKACGFVYIDTAPDYAQLFEDMSWEKTTKIEEARRQEIRPASYKLSKGTRWRLRFALKKKSENIVAAHAQPGNVLDLGCGDGDQLSRLSDGYTPFGIEISKEMAANAVERISAKEGGRIVNNSSLDGLKSFPDNFFTAVIMRSYLEHEMQPREVLEESYRALKAGGIAVIKVPNYGSLNRMVMGKRWCGFRYPDHLNYFTTRSLRMMGKACGFSVSFGILGQLPTSDSLHAIFRKNA